MADRSPVSLTRPATFRPAGAGTNLAAALAALPASLQQHWYVPPEAGLARGWLAAGHSARVSTDPDRDALLLCTDTPPAGNSGHPALALPAGSFTPDFAAACTARGQGLWLHHFATPALAAYAAGALGRPLGVTLPGQVLSVAGLGIALTGPAGCGKSEASLGLIDRGHQLVADDAFDTHFRPERGWCAEPPKRGAGMLAVRGLGVLEVRALYGAQALAPAATVGLEIRLVPGLRLTAEGLLKGQWLPPTLPGLSCLALPTVPGRNLPLLIETAVRQHSRYTGVPDLSGGNVGAQRPCMAPTADDTP